MISRICGRIISQGKNCLDIDINGLCYEVLVPQTVMQRLKDNLSPDGKVTLVTYHYHQIDMNRSMPVLIGFLSEIEKEFFEVFITVSGIGPRAALRALNQPISLISRAIDEGDVVFLRSLPGIGQQRAKEIVAKLQNKVGKFGLIRDGQEKIAAAAMQDIEAEALEVLLQLEYKKSEAQEMLKKAMESSSGIETTEELLNRVYRQRRDR
jgi:Holliday junction DNA helicase RuvA